MNLRDREIGGIRYRQDFLGGLLQRGAKKWGIGRREGHVAEDKLIESKALATV